MSANSDVTTEEISVTNAELESVSGGVMVNGIECYIYIVKRDDALSAIAEKYNTTVDILVALNKIRNKYLIYPGQRLYIPYV